MDTKRVHLDIDGVDVEVQLHPEGHTSIHATTVDGFVSVFLKTPKHADTAICVNGDWWVKP